MYLFLKLVMLLDDHETMHWYLAYGSIFQCFGNYALPVGWYFSTCYNEKLYIKITKTFVNHGYGRTM